MRIKSLLTCRTSAVVLTTLVIANVAACAGGSNPTRDIVAAVGAGPQVAETPDFVAQSRPGSLDYMPIGTAEEGRPTPARSADEIKAAEDELNALRTRNEAAGAAAARLGGTPPPEPVVLPTRQAKKRPQKSNSNGTR
jgi:hypothetical protein